MNLETAAGMSVENATEEDIEKAFTDEATRGEFVQLLATDGGSIQAADNGEGQFILQYVDAAGQVFSASEDATESDARAALQITCEAAPPGKNRANGSRRRRAPVACRSFCWESRFCCVPRLSGCVRRSRGEPHCRCLSSPQNTPIFRVRLSRAPVGTMAVGASLLNVEA
jgi:hypothetical protein